MLLEEKKNMGISSLSRAISQRVGTWTETLRRLRAQTLNHSATDPPIKQLEKQCTSNKSIEATGNSNNYGLFCRRSWTRSFSYHTPVRFLARMPPHVHDQHVLRFEGLLLADAFFPLANEVALVRRYVILIQMLKIGLGINYRMI